MYYMRILLNVVRGPTCYDDLKCINGVQYDSYRDACYALGLLDDDKEYVDGIAEASHWGSRDCLRHLFATLLLSDSLTRPEYVWEKCWNLLADDILYRRRIMMEHEALELIDEEIKGYYLVEIEKILRSSGKSLQDYHTMPFPNVEFFSNSRNRLIQNEMRYDKKALGDEHKRLVSSLTDEQRGVYDTIMKVIRFDKGGLFFIYGPGGTGKTFIWRTLSAGIRSKGDIVLNVVSSGIASLLLPSGRTTHSRFAIPLNPNENSTCNIKQGSPLAELIVRRKLIIWDEAPMMNKFCFEALDRTLRDIMRFSNPSSFDFPFGGRVVVLGGDFRQILPIVLNGSRQDVVQATINSSYLWKFCRVLRLTKNMRLQNVESNDQCNELRSFFKWIQSIGDGTLGGPNDGIASIDIPDDLLVDWSDNPVASIVHSTYPDLIKNIDDATYLQGRSILAPTLDVVESINDHMISLNTKELKTYLSSDSACSSESGADILQDIHTQEFLNSIRCSGLPNHELNLKVGTPVMLLRDIDHSIGLCNGTRLVITRLGKHFIEGKVLTRSNVGHIVVLPRMSLTPSNPRIPCKFNRRQYPVIVSYAMTINKSQDQTLSHVGLYLKKPVFGHGQLYVSVSRVTNRRGLKMLICDGDGRPTKSTTNVVFKEVLQNLN